MTWLFNRDSKTTGSLYLNEFIEKWSEIVDHLKEIVELPIDEVIIKNDGCKLSLVNRIEDYLNNHGIEVFNE